MRAANPSTTLGKRSSATFRQRLGQRCLSVAEGRRKTKGRHQSFTSACREHGAALITAMLVVALAATAASFMMWQNHLWLRQVENLENQAQARWIAHAAIQWGAAILDEDARDIDDESEKWAARLPPLTTEGGEVTGFIKDAQGLINLNNLVKNGRISQNDVVILTRLMIALDINPGSINALVDWLDADNEVTYPGGAEDLQYLALEPPYRSANRMLEDVNELYLVQGFNREIIRKLQPYVTALPAATSINVNTAPAEVLMALCSGLQMPDAVALIQFRGKTPFKDKTDFQKRLPQGVQVHDEDYNISSNFFNATAISRNGRAQLAYKALLERPGQGSTQTIWLKQIEE
ncbi:MAG: type II secretion system minor pseudopilin GspK [Sulfuricella denitrificans]|nr:type II secretion system minor pseudopilin GspK [Sulfuricella denitrificans]